MNPEVANLRLVLEISGWIGSILLGVCALPEVWVAYKTKKCNLQLWSIILWLLGEIFFLIPICILAPKGWLILNGGVNIIITTFLVYYKFKGIRNDIKAREIVECPYKKSQDYRLDIQSETKKKIDNKEVT